jgi:hypothetical protein
MKEFEEFEEFKELQEFKETATRTCRLKLCLGLVF